MEEQLFFGVDEIDSEDISLIDLETGFPFLVIKNELSTKANLKEGDRIKAWLIPDMSQKNCFVFKTITKV